MPEVEILCGSGDYDIQAMMKKSNIILLVSALVVAVLTAASINLFPGKAGAVESASTDFLSLGWKRFRMAEYSTAEKEFERARLAAKPGSKEMTKALYGLSIVNWLRTPDSNKPKAKEIFERIIKEDPADDLAVWSKLALVRMRHVVPVGETPDYPALCVDYEKLFAAHPDHPAGMEAFAYAQEVRLISFKPEDAQAAVAALRGFLDKNPDPRFACWAWELLSRAHKILGDGDEQLKDKLMLLKTKEMDPTNPRMNNSFLFWEIATLAQFEVGDLATAKEYYLKFRNEYPRDMRNFAVRRALEKIEKIENGEEGL